MIGENPPGVNIFSPSWMRISGVVRVRVSWDDTLDASEIRKKQLREKVVEIP